MTTIFNFVPRFFTNAKHKQTPLAVAAVLIAYLLSVVSAQTQTDRETIDLVVVKENESLEHHDHIDLATMLGGTVDNTSRNEAMLYQSGSYRGSIGNEVGTIGTLVVAGEWCASENWGIIENLVFAAPALQVVPSR